MFVAKGRNMSANIVRIFFTTETTPLPKSTTKAQKSIWQQRNDI